MHPPLFEKTRAINQQNVQIVSGVCVGIIETLAKWISDGGLNAGFVTLNLEHAMIGNSSRGVYDNPLNPPLLKGTLKVPP